MQNKSRNTILINHYDSNYQNLTELNRLVLFFLVALADLDTISANNGFPVAFWLLPTLLVLRK